VAVPHIVTSVHEYFYGTYFYITQALAMFTFMSAEVYERNKIRNQKARRAMMSGALKLPFLLQPNPNLYHLRNISNSLQ
jgi:hypothetical protein